MKTKTLSKFEEGQKVKMASDFYSFPGYQEGNIVEVVGSKTKGYYVKGECEWPHSVFVWEDQIERAD